MIVDLPATTTSGINRKLVDLRESGGAVALGRVMTLVIPMDEECTEWAIQAANEASQEHPCRVIGVVRGNRRGSARLDGQIRIGGDAGASEVILLRLFGPLADHGDSVVVPLLLPDAPIVVWWPGVSPVFPAQDPIGRMAQRRVTDATQNTFPIRALQDRAARHTPGDTDLAWSRVTLWRALLAAALDQPPYEPVHSATVTGGSDSPSAELLAAWLALYLKCPVTRVKTKAGSGLAGVRLVRRGGEVEVLRPEGEVATLRQPGQPERHVALPHRLDRDCLAEELRRLDPDDVFGDVVTKGMALVVSRRAGAAKDVPATPATVTVPSPVPPASPAVPEDGA